MLTAKQVCEAMTALDESVRVDPLCIEASLPKNEINYNSYSILFDNGHLRRVGWNRSGFTNLRNGAKLLPVIIPISSTKQFKGGEEIELMSGKKKQFYPKGFVSVNKKYLMKYFGTVYPVLNAHMLDNLRLYHIGMKEYEAAKNNRVRTKKPSRPPKLFKKRTPFAAQITTLDELFHRELCAKYDDLLDASDWRGEVNKLIGEDNLLKAYRALYNVKHATKKTIKTAVEELNKLLGDEQRITDSELQSIKAAAKEKRSDLITVSKAKDENGINKTFLDMWEKTSDSVFVKLPQEFTGVIGEEPEIPQLARLEAPAAANEAPAAAAKAETKEEREKDEKDKLHDEKRAVGAGILFLEGDKCSPFPGHFRTEPYQQGYRKAQESFFVHWVQEVYAKNMNLIWESDALWAQYREDKKSGYYCERPPFLNKQKLWSEANFALMNEMRRVRIQPGEDAADDSITFEVFVVPDFGGVDKNDLTNSERQDIENNLANLETADIKISTTKIFYRNVLEKKEQSQTVLDTYRAARQRLMEAAEKERAELLESVRNFSESEQKYKDYWNYPEKHEENMRQLIDKQKTSQLTGVVFDEELFGKMYNFYWGNDKEAQQRRSILALYLRLGNDSIFLLKDRNNKVITDGIKTKKNKTFKQLTNAQQKELLSNCEQWYDDNVIAGGESKESALQYIYTRMVRIVKIEAILKEETTMPMPGLEPKEYPRTDNSGNKSKYRIKLREATNDELKIILTDLKDKAQGEGVPRSVYRNYNNFADPDLALMQQDLAYGSRGYKAAEVSE